MNCTKKYKKIPCKGTLEIGYAYVEGLYGMGDAGPFDGFDLQCTKCGHVVKHWSVDDLKRMVEVSVKRSQEMPEYSRYRMN